MHILPRTNYALTYGSDDGQRVEKRSGKGPAVHLFSFALVAEVAHGLDDMALERPEVYLDLQSPLFLVVLVAARQVPDARRGAGSVGLDPLGDGERVTGRALDEDEHERTGNGVAHHQANDADVAEQERNKLPQVILALLRPRLFPLVVVPPAAALSFHGGGARYGADRGTLRVRSQPRSRPLDRSADGGDRLCIVRARQHRHCVASFAARREAPASTACRSVDRGGRVHLTASARHAAPHDESQSRGMCKTNPVRRTG